MCVRIVVRSFWLNSSIWATLAPMTSKAAHILLLSINLILNAMVNLLFISGGPVPGPEVCLPGWEDCKDGSCEPFHWLCIEHQSQAIIGR